MNINIFKRNNAQQTAALSAANRKVDLDNWSAGFSAYMQGAHPDSMPTEMHRRGYWAALDAEVSATMPKGN